MKGTDIARLAKAGHSFAVTGRYYVSKTYRKPENAQRKHWVNAHIQSLDVMYHTNSYAYDTPDNFRVAPKDERSKGYLVRFTNDQGVDQYTVRASIDFLDAWAYADQRWTAAETAAREAEARAIAEREARDAERERLDKLRQMQYEGVQAAYSTAGPTMERTLASILGPDAVFAVRPTIKEEIVGDKLNLWIDGNVTLTYLDMARLLEKYGEALDNAQ